MARSERSGFTLIELLLVVAIIGLLAAFLVLNLDGMTPTRRFKATIREIGASVERARGGAIAKGRPYGIVYDLDDNTYWILHPAKRELEEGEEEEFDILGEVFELPAGVKFHSFQVPGGDQETSGEAEVYFTPNGIDGSHIVAIERTDVDDEQILSIRFNAVIGAASVSRGVAEFDELEED